MNDLGTFEVGDNATGDTHDVIRVRTEVVVPRSSCSPHLVVLQQVRINKHAQLCAVTKGRHTKFGFCNLFDWTQDAALDRFRKECAI